MDRMTETEARELLEPVLGTGLSAGVSQQKFLS